MGYFSNSTQWSIWAIDNCNRCVHDSGGCSVVFLHMAWNYDAIGEGDEADKAIALNTLIPLSGIHNGQCNLFHKKEQISP